jgi:hypothetical protein
MRRWHILGIAMSCSLIATASLAEADNCRRIKAEIDLVAGTIEGNFGLEGTVVFRSDSTGTVPTTAPAGSSVFSGLLTITTDRGVLVMRETGMFSGRAGNPLGGALYSLGEAVSGTDRFAGVTGDVFFTGHRVNGQFLVDVRGELCQP